MFLGTTVKKTSDQKTANWGDTQFTNYADVSGSYQGNLVKSDSNWTIKIYAPNVKFPKTGY